MRIQTTLALALTTAAARSVERPPLACDRDERLWRAWNVVAPEPANWSRATMDAAERFLDGAARPRLRRPKVYVYPFPDAFENVSNIWAEAGLDETGTAAYFSNKPHVFPGSYFQIAYGAKGPAHAASAWTRPKDGCDDERCRADGGLRWTPSDPLFSEDPLPGVVDGARCSFARPPTQHATGLAVHRGLEAAYDRLVFDPKDADLFFIPDHATRPATAKKATKAAMAKVCEALGRLWSKHLETFRTRDGESYLSRNDGRDHFFARNRAWHYAEPKSLAEDLDLADRRDVQGDECAWTREGVARNAARLMLETQAPYQRALAGHRPVPYVAALTRAAVDAQPARCSYRSEDAPRKHRAAVLVGGTSGGFNDEDHGRLESGGAARRRLTAQCAAWDACVSSRPPGPDGGKPTVTYSEIYLNADFCVQPPGHSAARKGIVDSLVAGCVPVLFRGPVAPGVASPWDQRDLWPWHWPGQRLSSIEISADDLERRGLRAILESVSERQLRAMRRAIREQAPGLLWPLSRKDARPTVANALGIAMHHLGHLALAPPAARGCDAAALRGG